MKQNYTNVKLKCISLYSGADNLGDGFIQAGHEIILCVEHDKDCCETIKLNHPDIEVINDKVSNVLSTLPKADCVIGGPPCPEFSRANSNRTFDLCEVNNFRKAIEITKAKHHFMENVQDLFKVHKERNFLINCADYGVPQTRIRRIFTDLPLPEPTHSEFPSERLFGENLKKWVSVREALKLDGIIEDRKTKYFNETEFRRYSVDRPHHTIITDSRDFFISPTGFKEKNKKLISRSISEPSQTIVNGNDMKFTNYKIYSTKYLIGKNPIMYEKNKPNLLNQTYLSVTAKERLTPLKMICDVDYARKLTNEELTILQGFRSDFKFYGNKTSVRKQIGNALPSAISKAFGEKLNVTLMNKVN